MTSSPSLGRRHRATIVADYDLVLWAVRDPELHDLPEAAVAVPFGDRPSPAEAEALDRVAALVPGRVLLSHPAWSAARIEVAVAGWSAEKTGRADLRFVHDPDLAPSRTIERLI